jgi:hypothetical protein
MNKQSYWQENAGLLFETTCGLIESINQNAEEFLANTGIVANTELLIKQKSSKELMICLLQEANRLFLDEEMPEGMIQVARGKLNPDLKAYIQTSEVIRIWDIPFNREYAEKMIHLDSIVHSPREFYLWEHLLDCLGDPPIQKTT